MTVLIKSAAAGSGANVRTLALESPLPRTQPPVVVDPDIAALRRQVEDLSLQLNLKMLEIDRLKDLADKSFQSGEAKGYAAGLSEGVEQRDRSLAILSDGVGRAVDAIKSDMVGLERLAVLIAREALGKMIGDPEQGGAWLAALVRRQLEQIDAHSILRIEVCQAEFPDAGALAALVDQIGRPGLNVAGSAELAPGDCRIKLNLGGLEVGLDQQWSRLDAALLEMAEPRAAP